MFGLVDDELRAAVLVGEASTLFDPMLDTLGGFRDGMGDRRESPSRIVTAVVFVGQSRAESLSLGVSVGQYLVGDADEGVVAARPVSRRAGWCRGVEKRLARPEASDVFVVASGANRNTRCLVLIGKPVGMLDHELFADGGKQFGLVGITSGHEGFRKRLGRWWSPPVPSLKFVGAQAFGLLFGAAHVVISVGGIVEVLVDAVVAFASLEHIVDVRRIVDPSNAVEHGFVDHFLFFRGQGFHVLDKRRGFAGRHSKAAVLSDESLVGVWIVGEFGAFGNSDLD